jgi:hypothetical protein
MAQSKTILARSCRSEGESTKFVRTVQPNKDAIVNTDTDRDVIQTQARNDWIGYGGLGVNSPCQRNRLWPRRPRPAKGNHIRNKTVKSGLRCRAHTRKIRLASYWGDQRVACGYIRRGKQMEPRRSIGLGAQHAVIREIPKTCIINPKVVLSIIVAARAFAENATPNTTKNENQLSRFIQSSYTAFGKGNEVYSQSHAVAMLRDASIGRHRPRPSGKALLHGLALLRLRRLAPVVSCRAC